MGARYCLLPAPGQLTLTLIEARSQAAAPLIRVVFPRTAEG